LFFRFRDECRLWVDGRGVGLGVAFGLGGGMCLSTQGVMPGSMRTSGSVVGFGSAVAALATATSIGRSREAPTATTMVKPRAKTITHAPTFRRGLSPGRG
jgi:hypothetical protein